MRSCLDRGGYENGFSTADSSMSVRHSYPRDIGNGQKAPVSTLFEQGGNKYLQNTILSHISIRSHLSYVFFFSFNTTVGLQKILSLLESDDANVRIHAVKVVANLAAEGG